MALTDMQIVGKSLRARLFSTVVTAISVAVAVALMLTLLAMKDSAQSSFKRGAGNMHVVVAAGGQSPLELVLDAVFYKTAPPKHLEWKRAEELAKDPRIQWAVPVLQGDNYKGFPTMATTPDFFTKFQPVDGEPFEFAQGGMFKETFDVVLGSQAALGTGTKIGDKILITHGMSKGGHTHEEFKYTVVGILKRTGTAHDRGVFMTLGSSWLIHADEKREEEARAKSTASVKVEHEEPTLENLKPEEKLVTAVFVRAATPVILGQVFNDLRTDPTLTAARVAAEIDSLWTIVGSIDKIVVVIAGAVMVSSGIGILLALYNSMEQRRRQIAVLRVLGAGRIRVFGLVLTESAIIGLMGAVAGVAVGWGAMVAVSGQMLERYNLVVQPEGRVFAEYAFILVVAAVGLAAVAGVIPALRAYWMPVVKNLRVMG